MGAVYTQLSITERCRIERWRHAKVIEELVAPQDHEDGEIVFVGRALTESAVQVLHFCCAPYGGAEMIQGEQSVDVIDAVQIGERVRVINLRVRIAMDATVWQGADM